MIYFIKMQSQNQQPEFLCLLILPLLPISCPVWFLSPETPVRILECRIQDQHHSPSVLTLQLQSPQGLRNTWASPGLLCCLYHTVNQTVSDLTRYICDPLSNYGRSETKDDMALEATGRAMMFNNVITIDLRFEEMNILSKHLRFFYLKNTVT